MTRRDERAALWDIDDSARAAVEFLGSISLEEYLNDELLRSAVERKLIIIGEAIARLQSTNPSLAEELHVPTHRIAALRNILVHGYDRIDDARVFNTISEDLPHLRNAVRHLLGE